MILIKGASQRSSKFPDRNRETSRNDITKFRLMLNHYFIGSVALHPEKLALDTIYVQHRYRPTFPNETCRDGEPSIASSHISNSHRTELL